MSRPDDCIDSTGCGYPGACWCDLDEAGIWTWTIRWTSFWGRTKTVETHWLHSDCKSLAFQCAANNGWRPRRWWQFWRFADTPNPEWFP